MKIRVHNTKTSHIEMFNNYTFMINNCFREKITLVDIINRPLIYIQINININ